MNSEATRPRLVMERKPSPAKPSKPTKPSKPSTPSKPPKPTTQKPPTQTSTAPTSTTSTSTMPFNKALLIGINYLGTSCALRGCIYDTVALRQYIETEVGVTAGGVKMLNEATNNNADRPTMANILAGIAWLVAGATPQSRLLLQYSGHGSYVSDNNGDEKDGRDETWCPLDYDASGFLLDDVIRKVLIDPLPAGCRLVVISDSCHSGSVTDLKYSYNIDYKNGTATCQTDVLEKETAATVITISGSRDSETSADAYISGQYQGAMTFSLLNSLKSLKQQGRSTTLQSLLCEMFRFLKTNNYSQNPVLSTGQAMNLTTTSLF